MKTAEQLYQERDKRVKDAVTLKIPDRVPIIISPGAFPSINYGITMEEAFNDYDKAAELFDKFYNDFQPDLAWDTTLMYPAKAMKLLDMQWLRWPGYELDSNSSVQFLEDEYMKADEYDELIHDPTNYITTKYIPRSFKALEGFKHLGALRDSIFLGFFSSLPPFTNPELQASLKVAAEVGEELNKWFASIFAYRYKLKEKGFPAAYGAWAFAPFDRVSDTMRGTIPALLDMRKNPDKILEAVDMFTPLILESAIQGAQAMGNPYIWIALHKAIDSFMSVEQFNKFYWPSLKKVIDGLVKAGLTPLIYGEGQLDSRYETFSDVPVGKVIYHFEKGDMFKAKDILGNVACIMGNISNISLAYSTPDDIKDECKKLIDYCGKDGGYIMDTGASIDDVKFENLKAMFDFTQEYGKY